MRVLGVSTYHDSSVCLMEDGKILRYYKEERLSRVKRDMKPILSLLEIYKEYGRNINAILFADPPDDVTHTLCKKLWTCEIKIFPKSHHLYHAALAFMWSGFDDATTFVVDRNGSMFSNYGDTMVESESAFVSSRYGFNALYKSFWRLTAYEDGKNLKKAIDGVKQYYDTADIVCDSRLNITQVYESATSLINENPLDNGKTMGLSSYGKRGNENFKKYFLDSIPLDRYFIQYDDKIKLVGDEEVDHFRVVNKEFQDFILKDTVPEKNYNFYADYALEIQHQTQEALGDLVEKYTKKQSKNVVITGGYGLNVVANSYLTKRFPDLNFFFCPIADDSGNSIGVAVNYFMPDVENFDMKKTAIHGREYAIPKEYEKCNVEFIADQLCNQKSVAVFNGMAEAGPRALGNRSILFDATNKDAKEIVNRIKKREWYRPFAAICLREDADELFEMVDTVNSDYMTMSFDVKSARIPGVTHVDNTCRIQTISEDHHLYTLLKLIKQKIGIGVLLNTSFNVAGRPLVETPQDARRVFKNTNLDILWFPETNQFIMKE